MRVPHDKVGQRRIWTLGDDDHQVLVDYFYKKLATLESKARLAAIIVAAPQKLEGTAKG